MFLTFISLMMMDRKSIRLDSKYNHENCKAKLNSFNTKEVLSYVGSTYIDQEDQFINDMIHKQPDRGDLIACFCH